MSDFQCVMGGRLLVMRRRPLNRGPQRLVDLMMTGAVRMDPRFPSGDIPLHLPR